MISREEDGEKPIAQGLAKGETLWATEGLSSDL